DRSGRRFVLTCPNWPAPLHLLGGIFGWRALPWREKLATLRLAPDLRRERSLAPALWPEVETVAGWLDRRGQRGRIREWLWEPLAVAALNQAPDEAAAAPFRRVLQLMFAGSRTDASLAFPLRPLHEMYAQPARRFIEHHGGTVTLNALARVKIENGRVAGLDVRGEPIAATDVIAAVPWFALDSLLT